MKKIICEDKQRFHHPYAYALIIILGGLAIIRLVEISLDSSYSAGDAWAFLLVLLGMLGIIGYLRRVTMMIRLSQKKILIRFKGVPLPSKKIALKDIRSVNFFKPPQATLLSGWMVHLPSEYKSYDFGDQGAVSIHTWDGKSYLIFSDKLYNKKQELKALVKAWPTV